MLIKSALLGHAVNYYEFWEHRLMVILFRSCHYPLKNQKFSYASSKDTVLADKKFLNVQL